jgi:hypothetical protein
MRWPYPWTRTRPTAGFDFHAAEQEFTKRRRLGRAGNTLCVSTGGSYIVSRPEELDSWLRGYLAATGQSRVWSSELRASFQAWLSAAADPVPPGQLVKHN